MFPRNPFAPLLGSILLAALHAAPLGPPEIRDGQLLAQARLTLGAVAPFTVGKGKWAVESSALWSSTFAQVQSAPGEAPAWRRYLLDGETLLLAATVRYGLAENLDLSMRLRVEGRGGGALDGPIADWHGKTGFPDGDRSAFVQNAFRVEGRLVDGAPFSWSDRSGFGLGSLEWGVRWRILGDNAGGAALAILPLLALPTGTGVFAGHGFAAAVEAVGNLPLGAHLNFYGGLGATVQDPGPVLGILFVPARLHAFAAVEWRPGSLWALVAEVNAASRLIANIDEYPGFHSLLNLSARIGLGNHARIDLGITENLEAQRATTDFAL